MAHRRDDDDGGGGGGWDPLVNVDFFVVGTPSTVWLNIGACRLADVPHTFAGVLKQHPRFKQRLTSQQHRMRGLFFEVKEVISLASDPSRSQQTSFFVNTSILDDDNDDDDVSLK